MQIIKEELKMTKNYMISTIYANYQLHCTKAEAMAKFQHFAKIQRDVSLHEWTENGCRKIAESHR